MIDGDTTKDKNKVITHIKDHESKKHMFRIMQRYLKPQNKAGITHLNIPEWDKFDFLLIMAFGSCFHAHPPIQ
eukprot:629454-Ditylum_brightwellii.AAC.1